MSYCLAVPAYWFADDMNSLSNVGGINIRRRSRRICLRIVRRYRFAHSLICQMVWFSDPRICLLLAWQKIFSFGTALVSLEYLSAINIPYWFLSVVLGMGPKMFIATKSSGPHEGNIWSGRFHDGNNWSGRLWFYWLPFLAQLMHVRQSHIRHSPCRASSIRV